MTDPIQRWTIKPLVVKTSGLVIDADPEGEWVKAADAAAHEAAAVAAERAKNMPWTCSKDGTLNPYGFACIECIRLAAYEQGHADGYARGVADAKAKS
jgi:hypothetical protein